MYDRDTDTLSLGSEMISHNFGMMDMYKDSSHEKDAYHIEKSLSTLEETAAKVIAKLEAERSNGLVTLLRSEVNTLRKFLFIMAYRNSSHYQQWIEGKMDPPTLSMVNNFASEHGLEGVRHVYLHNIRHLLDTEHWEIPKSKDILWVTRTDYMLEKDHMSLALYEAPPGVEFILTDRAYGTWEGVRGDPMYYQLIGIPYDPNSSIALSQTYPVSPKLALILRHNHLLEESIMRGLNKPIPSNPMGINLSKSYYSEFPIQRTDVTYDPPPLFDHRKLQNANTADFEQKWAESLGGEIGSRVRDRLTFRCFTLPVAQARMINNLLLENCGSRITFISIIPLYKSIKFGYERDTVLEHKANHSLLVRKLVDAHRASQETFMADLTRATLAMSLTTDSSTAESSNTERRFRLGPPAKTPESMGTTRKSSEPTGDGKPKPRRSRGRGSR